MFSAADAVEKGGKKMGVISQTLKKPGGFGSSWQAYLEGFSLNHKELGDPLLYVQTTSGSFTGKFIQVAGPVLILENPEKTKLLGGDQNGMANVTYHLVSVSAITAITVRVAE